MLPTLSSLTLTNTLQTKSAETFWSTYVCRKITNKNYIEKLQKDLDTLGEWSVENEMKINPAKSKAIRFTRARFQNPLGYSLGDQHIRGARSCKCLGIILRSDLNWVNQVNYTVRKAWKVLHFVMRFSKKEIGIQKCSLHVIGKYYSWIRGCRLECMHRRTDKSARPSTDESCSMY